MPKEKERYDVTITAGAITNTTKAQNISKRSVLHMIEDAIEEHGSVAVQVIEVTGRDE